MGLKGLFPEIPTISGERIVLRQLTLADADGLREIAESDAVGRYLPTFLLEKQTDDMEELIRRLYDDLMEESLFFAVCLNDEFCGLMELYGYREPLHKISIGYRLKENCWGKGVATEALELMLAYLESHTNIEIITASSMVENYASANVLRKCGFTLVVHSAEEDWGFDTPTLADKWIR